MHPNSKSSYIAVKRYIYAVVWLCVNSKVRKFGTLAYSFLGEIDLRYLCGNFIFTSSKHKRNCYIFPRVAARNFVCCKFVDFTLNKF